MHNMILLKSIWQKIFSAEKYYDTKADACMRLSKIARIRGDMEGAVKMWAEQLAYLDSAEPEPSRLCDIPKRYFSGAQKLRTK